jgi:hypothetical protein
VPPRLCTLGLVMKIKDRRAVAIRRPPLRIRVGDFITAIDG